MFIINCLCFFYLCARMLVCAAVATIVTPVIFVGLVFMVAAQAILGRERSK